MKFSCNKPRTTPDPVIKKPLDKWEWHKTFALFPVRVSEFECRWLEYVEQRLTKGALAEGCEWLRVTEWQYRSIR